MNIAQAKRIAIVDYLAKHGHQPVQRRGNQWWFKSPVRNEQTPSFKVNVDLNAWYDFGIGQGGDILDLAKALERVQSLSEALARIEFAMGGDYEPVERVFDPVPPELPVIKAAVPLSAKSLINYSQSRGIAHDVAREYLTQIHYQRNGKDFFALGVKNQSGGYELRSKLFKGTLGNKDLTVFPGNPNESMVFEGIFDFLTYVALKGRPSATVVVLNGTGLRDRCVETLRPLQPARIELYRDNDAGGESLFAFMKDQFPGIQVVDCAGQYAGFKDLNEWHIASTAMPMLARP